jgi:hypothetical protein
MQLSPVLPFDGLRYACGRFSERGPALATELQSINQSITFSAFLRNKSPPLETEAAGSGRGARGMNLTKGG